MIPARKGLRALPPAPFICVITSYSIHYTKLYEDVRAESGGGDMDPVGRGAEERQAGGPAHGRLRITSYNVCYTKLLRVLLHVGVAGARRHVPVDRADLVARLVLAHLAELHALAPERAGELAREHLVHVAAHPQLELADFLSYNFV